MLHFVGTFSLSSHYSNETETCLPFRLIDMKLWNETTIYRSPKDHQKENTKNMVKTRNLLALTCTLSQARVCNCFRWISLRKKENTVKRDNCCSSFLSVCHVSCPLHFSVISVCLSVFFMPHNRQQIRFTFTEEMT